MSSQVTTLSVKGMHCASCVRRVERALTALNGVERVNVDLLAARAVVEYVPEQVTERQLEEAVRNAGFQVPG